MRVPLISFFTGGGFLDIGLHQAGFQVLWTNEPNPQFADMYEAAMLALREAWDDSSNPSKVDSRSSITRVTAAEIMATTFGNGRPPLFGVVGGPPCPDFSNGGTHAGSEGTSAD